MPSLFDANSVLAWVSERLAVAMRQAEDRDNVLVKSNLIDLELLKEDNKGQGLGTFERSLKKSFSVKTTHFKSNLFAFRNDCWIKWNHATESLLDSISSAEVKNQLGLSLFENKIGHQLLAYVNESVTLNNPFIDPSFMSRVFLKDRASMLFRTAVKIGKVFVQPINKLFSCIRDVEYRAKARILISVVFSRFNFVNAKRSLSVNDTSKISQFKRIINDFCIFNYWHISSMDYVCI
jgi:hypothetical protein